MHLKIARRTTPLVATIDGGEGRDSVDEFRDFCISAS
jgi:hypothetical protein